MPDHLRAEFVGIEVRAERAELRRVECRWVDVEPEGVRAGGPVGFAGLVLVVVTVRVVAGEAEREIAHGSTVPTDYPGAG